MTGSSQQRTLLISLNRTEEKICLLEEDKAVEVYIWPHENKPRIGEIYLGIVDNIVPGLQAVFVDIGGPKNGYLFFSKKEKCEAFESGQKIFVQIQKQETQEKGSKLTDDFFLTGKYLVYFPRNSFRKVSKKIEGEERQRLYDFLENIPFLKGGIIVRTAAQTMDEEALLNEARQLQTKWNKIQLKFDKMKTPGLVHQEKTNLSSWLRDAASIRFTSTYTDDEELYYWLKEYFAPLPDQQKPAVHYHSKGDLFEYFEVNKVIKQSLKNKVWLSSGGYLLISEKPFLTTLDVNSGRFAGSAQRSLADTASHINREAAAQIARQIRLRNLGGLIVVDFIDLKNNTEIETVCSLIKEELNKSLIKSDVIGVNEVGLLTIVRKRKYSSLKDILTKPCPCCEGSGNYPNAFYHLLMTRQAILQQYSAHNIFNFFLQIPSSLKELFQEMVHDLAEDYNISVELKISRSLNEDDFDIQQHLENNSGETL